LCNSDESAMKCFIFTDVVPKICRDNAIKEEAGRTVGTGEDCQTERDATIWRTKWNYSLRASSTKRF
jgi:hypothetical protein